ncbi:unnamed protein product [Mytilus edulis]|uniref:DDE-1 domain-containing protein n=1 Tax=Mytilus edulis TaxID=6550 RepID=A0A8S3TRX6_MYTED|nr:unnamed protein product [Mytilus edulis]
MASYGYGYTRQEITDLATDFAHTINIKPGNEELTLRWEKNGGLMNGATSGAVSDLGWSNTNIFRQYLTDHFPKYVPGRNNDNIILLLNWHKSHVAVDIIEWAQEDHIIIHILPAQTRHILQPLDVGCYGPLQRTCIYDNKCHKNIRQNYSVITRYKICELACKAYQKALSSENLQSAFRKT